MCGQGVFPGIRRISLTGTVPTNATQQQLDAIRDQVCVSLKLIAIQIANNQQLRGFLYRVLYTAVCAVCVGVHKARWWLSGAESWHTAAYSGVRGEVTGGLTE